ncbi:hypothetical protein EYF80_058800 [Liparis tanakae]|uniref:Uncharacterized protein n=1 Tax=Liparis tanakae TaxID=230148 RepID=A0A4Z2EQ28_9TELE|nr:hypothetical protein EYF80_058800 [Liparis tanakae]
MWMMLVEKEARIIPREAKRPPTIITGRQPKRFTRMLHRGPEEEEGSPTPNSRMSSLKNTLTALGKA